MLLDGPEGRATVEFAIHGSCLEMQEGLRRRRDRPTSFPSERFFEIRDGRTVRVTTYYSLSDWLRQLGA